MNQKVQQAISDTGIESKGALASGTVWGGAVVTLAGLQGVLTHIGIVSPDEIQNLAGDLAGLIGGLLVIWKRITTIKLISGWF